MPSDSVIRPPPLGSGDIPASAFTVAKAGLYTHKCTRNTAIADGTRDALCGYAPVEILSIAAQL